MSDYSFLSKIALGTQPSGQAVSYVAVQGTNVEIKAKPRVFGKEGVVTLVDGRRVRSQSDTKYHVDVELSWPHMDPLAYEALSAWARAAYDEPSSTRFWFSPKYGTSGAPATGFDAIEVVPDFSPEGGILTLAYDDRIIRRESSITLMGAALVLSTSLPSWVK